MNSTGNQRNRRLLVLVCGLCAVALLVGCAPGMQVHFKPVDSPAVIEWAQRFPAEEPVTLVPIGLAKAGDGLLLYGYFESRNTVIRSVMLRSDKSKHKWYEAGKSFAGAQVLAVSTPEELTAFALVAEVAEGPGPLHVLSTDDGWVSWKHMSDVPKDHYSGMPTHFHFSSASTGEVHLQYLDENPENLRPVLVTGNGAKSWIAFQETQDKKPEPLSDKPLELEADGGVYRIVTEELSLRLMFDHPDPKKSGEVMVFSRSLPYSSVIATSVDCGCPKYKGLMQ